MLKAKKVKKSFRKSLPKDYISLVNADLKRRKKNVYSAGHISKVANGSVVNMEIMTSLLNVKWRHDKKIAELKSKQEGRNVKFFKNHFKGAQFKVK